MDGARTAVGRDKAGLGDSPSQMLAAAGFKRAGLFALVFIVVIKRREVSLAYE